MKRFLMVAVAGLLALAAYKPAEATTINPGDTQAISTNNLPNSAGFTSINKVFTFTLSAAVDTTIEIFANVVPGSGSAITLGNPTLFYMDDPSGPIAVAPSSGAGLVGNSFEGIYASLAAGDYEFLVNGLYKGNKASVNGFISAAPIPPALLMFVTALAGLSVFGYRRKKLDV